MATFPTDPVPNYPIEIEPEWSTAISRVETGGEQRKQKSLFPRYNVRVKYKVLTQAKMQTLWEFYQARKGAYESFYIYDLVAMDHDLQFIAVADGTTEIWDIPGSSTSSHTVYSNGTELVLNYDYHVLIGGGASDSDRLDFGRKLYGGTGNLSGAVYEWNGIDAWVEVAPQLGAETHIYSLAVYNSKLYGGTVPNGKLYQWNDTDAWVEVAPKLGAETSIRSLAVYNSKLYGGTYPNGKLYEWNDTDAWVEVAPQLGVETDIRSLAVYNSKLYGGTVPNGKLYEWNDTDAWVEVAPQLGAETGIFSLVVYNSKLYGGTYPNGKLYEWNGIDAWVEVAPQLGGEPYIYALIVYNGKLYGGTVGNGKLYEWNDVDSWVEVAPQAGGTETAIRSLAVYNSKLYGGTASNGKLYEWNGIDAWVEVASKLGTETYIYSLAVLPKPPTAGTLLTADFTGFLRMKVRFENDKLTREMFFTTLSSMGLSMIGLKVT